MAEPEPERSGPFRERNGSSVLVDDRKEEIRRYVKELLSDDYDVRARSVSVLEKYGEDAAEVLVETLIKKADHPHALANFSDALAEIGKPSLNVILHAFNHVREIQRCEDVYLLESFVDLVALLGDRRAIATLLEQLAKLNRKARKGGDARLVHCCEAARTRIHRVLVDLGEKSGVEDLLEMLGDGRRRVRDGVVDCLARIGDCRAFVPLVRLYDIEEHVSFSGAQLIKETIREIARREKVTADDRIFKDLTEAEKAILERVLPRSKNGNGKH